MESQLQRYARRLVEEQLGHTRLQLAQIADDISTVKTEQPSKFNDEDMIRPFNLGIGMVMIIDKNYLSTLKDHLDNHNEKFVVLGEVIKK